MKQNLPIVPDPLGKSKIGVCILPICSWEDPVGHSSLCHGKNGKRDADAKVYGGIRPIAEVGRDNRYVSALFYAACYFILSVAVVNLRSQPQTSP
ncbi:Uncharacterized protein DBV15_07552, partial [Temnothorax longispinosus]